jgi:hypothetical protein
LPAGEREAFLKKYRTKLSVQYGVVMKEYVEVPDSLLKKTAELAKVFAVSVAYVNGLKAKPTTRKKPTTKQAVARGKRVASKTTKKAATGLKKKRTPRASRSASTGRAATKKKPAKKSSRRVPKKRAKAKVR